MLYPLSYEGVAKGYPGAMAPPAARGVPNVDNRAHGC